MTGATPVDFDALLATLGGDRQVTVALLTTFTEELSADIADCEQALTQQDTEALRGIAHRIKGTSANLQATMLSAAARELEQASSEASEAVRAIKHRVMLEQAQSVRDAIEAVGKEQGFTYIFDTSTGVTLYNGGEDVTDLVKTKLGM